MMPLCKRLRRRRQYAAALRTIRQGKQAAAEAAIHRIQTELKGRVAFLGAYGKRLLPAVWRSLRHIDRLTAAIPGPVMLAPEHWGDEPLINAVCTDSSRLQRMLRSDSTLKAYFQSSEVQQAVGLLTAKKREKVVSGVEKTGQIVRRGMLQQAVYFENHKIIAPAADLKAAQAEYRLQLMVELMRAMTVRIEALKEWHAELEVERRRLGLLIDDPAVSVKDRRRRSEILPEAAAMRGKVDGELKDIAEVLDADNGFFSFVRNALLQPEGWLVAETLQFNLSRLGIRLDPASDEPGNAFSLVQFRLGEENPHHWVAVWVQVARQAVERPHNT